MKSLICRIVIGLVCLGLVTSNSCVSPQSTTGAEISAVPTEPSIINKIEEKQTIEAVAPATKTPIVSAEEKQTKEPEPKVEPTRVVADILANSAAYCGEEVIIVGTYQGWDWQEQVGIGPPVTRSDWVIADASGAIYVAARDAETGALELDPTDSQKVILLLVKGVVRMSRQGQPYIEPLEIKILQNKED